MANKALLVEHSFAVANRKLSPQSHNHGPWKAASNNCHFLVGDRSFNSSSISSIGKAIDFPGILNDVFVGFQADGRRNLAVSGIDFKPRFLQKWLFP
jgi:hypothetical protein